MPVFEMILALLLGAALLAMERSFAGYRPLIGPIANFWCSLLVRHY